MSVNTETHITAPDLIDPVIGFRSWTYVEAHAAIPAAYKIVGKKQYAEFIPPREYVTLPDGKIVQNMQAVGEAWKKWRDSIYGDGERVCVRPEMPASEGYLSSRGNFRWEYAEQKAVCGNGTGHSAPHHNCECGLYSYYEPKDVSGRARGIVSCTGVIEAHVTGMRSQYMKIEHLFGGPNLQVFAERIKVPFTDIRQFDSAQKIAEVILATAREYGSVLPESMRPKANKADTLDAYMSAFDRLAQQRQRRWKQEMNQAQSDPYKGVFQSRYPKKRTLDDHKRLIEEAMRISEQNMKDILGGQS